MRPVEPTPDLLSDLFDTLQLRTGVIASFRMPAPWGINVPYFGPALFYAVVEGRLWLEVEGEPPCDVRAGDVFLLAAGTTHTARSDRGAHAVHIADLFETQGLAPWRPGQRLEAPIIVDVEGGRNVTRFLTVLLDFPDSGPNSLRQNLPAVIHLSAEENRITPWLPPAVQSIVAGPGDGRTGYGAMANRLAELLFLNTIRSHLVLRPEAARGWLRGMSHPQVARVLALLHRDPGRDWTVEALARESGMSRSAFAEVFSRLMGEAPFGYLTGLRMRLAAERIAAGRCSVKTASQDLGYASQKAFGHAFSRVIGRSPGTLKPGRGRRL